MKHEIKITEYFSRQTKRLEKKYPHIRKDIFTVLTSVDAQPEIGERIQGLGKCIYKLRVPSSDMKKGKSGGFRIIYYVVERNKIIYLLSIYAKAKKESKEFAFALL